MIIRHKNRHLTFIYIVLGLILLHIGCKKGEDEVEPPTYINITINPNSTEYQELNTVGGWTYLPATTPSRGIIVYRLSQDNFMAYDRMPPYEPDQCCNNGVCTYLIVDMPFVEDTCTSSIYQILDGAPFSGPSSTPLIRYTTYYDGISLQIIS